MAFIGPNTKTSRQFWGLLPNKSLWVHDFHWKWLSSDCDEPCSSSIWSHSFTHASLPFYIAECISSDPWLDHKILLLLQLPLSEIIEITTKKVTKRTHEAKSCYTLIHEFWVTKNTHFPGLLTANLTLTLLYFTFLLYTYGPNRKLIEMKESLVFTTRCLIGLDFVRMFAVKWKVYTFGKPLIRHINYKR